MRILTSLILYFIVTALPSMLAAQVEVNVNFDVRHVVGGIDSFQREKFIVLHSSAADSDYNGIDDKLDSLVNLYDAYFGRETGRLRFASSQVNQDPARPGFADPASITDWGNRLNTNYANNTNRHGLEKGRVITAAQTIPFYPNGANPVNAGAPSAEHWFFSTINTTEEPFASATGEFMGRFLRDGYGTGGTDGTPRPTFIEVMNEPVWPLVDVNRYGGGTLDDIFTMHLTVADSVRKYSPESLIGGYCTAFPDFEKVGAAPENNQLFGQWEERWKRFVDEVGPEMDFYSLHFYDFHSLGGRELLRKGANMEATLDMLEHYSTIKDGAVKPMVISEYGAQLNDFYQEQWSPGRDWYILKSFSSMMMQFMERPNTIEKTVPFALHKAEFGFGGLGPGLPYPWRLLRRANEPAEYSGDWMFTEVVKFYELWSDVRGIRVDTKSSDADIMVDAFVDQHNNKGYLVLNSLDEADREIDLSTFGISVANVSGVKIKHLFLDEAADAPVLDVTEMTVMPASVTLAEEACMIIELTFTATPEVTESSTEEKIGYKGMLFEGGIKVPFFITWPAGLPAGKTYPEVVSALDVFPTVLEAAGGALAEHPRLDGKNLTPYLYGNDTGTPHDQLFWRAVGGWEYAVRDGDYKLCQLARKNKTMLFNLKEDPYERRDLSKVNPELVQKLTATYEAWDAKNIDHGWEDPHIEGSNKAERKMENQRKRAQGPTASGG